MAYADDLGVLDVTAVEVLLEESNGLSLLDLVVFLSASLPFFSSAGGASSSLVLAGAVPPLFTISFYRKR
tara:strand:- start:395 stop:604 length:210 start_codon:yes stop_codon:yes gene_type:complete